MFMNNLLSPTNRFYYTLPCIFAKKFQPKKKGEKNKTLVLGLPFPIGMASAWRSWERDLLGDPGVSHTAKELALSKSKCPACSRNFSSSFERRLNCSLCVRHFCSNSRTLACQRTQGRGGGRVCVLYII